MIIMRRGRNNGFKVLLAFLFFLFLIQYISGISGINYFRLPAYFDALIYICVFVAYMLKYRKNNLLCFELMAVPVAFLGLFFDDLIYPLSSEFSSLLTIGDEVTRQKSEDIQMMAFFALLLGASIGNDYNNNKSFNFGIYKTKKVSYGFFIIIIVSVILLLIIYDFSTGVFSSWFYYSNSNIMDVDDRNQGLGHLTCLLLAASCVEIVRLRNKGITDFKSFILNINKLFLAECLGISALLFFSGNRNEMLLILLPLVVGYTVCIQRISNRTILIFILVGVLLMAMAGMSRGDSVALDSGTLGIFSLTRDFSGLGYNTDFLVQYTDKNGAIYLSGLIPMLLSGIPYIGNVIINSFDITGPISSAILCTDSVFNASSGLGTSLIGDLYYTGGTVGVVLYIFFFGYLMSCLYKSDRDMNIYWLVFYTYMVSNAVYYIRSSWAFPITQIEYAMIIVLLGNLFFSTKTKKLQIK